MNDTALLGFTGSLTRDARLVFEVLEGLQGDFLEIAMPDGNNYRFGQGPSGVVLHVRDEAVFRKVLARGDIGLAEAYLDGDWDTTDLSRLLTLLAQNHERLRSVVYGRWFHLLTARLRHWLNRNSRSGSKRNIMAHYDLGNEFYSLWLDPSMTYSSALYRWEGKDDLINAQQSKYRRILQRLQAKPGQRVLEVGCGWGGFAELAQRQGLAVTGLSLSPTQLAWARARVPEADLRLQDYRDTCEPFDHVVSIEMFEAVGERWWPAYFKTVARALKPDGRAMIQTITIRDELFSIYRRSTDFIQQYIFPGGMLPSCVAFRREAARAGLVVSDEYAFGEDYARTLSEWRQSFERHWPRIAALGFDEKFRRMWRFYLSYSEAGFRSGNIDVVQFEIRHQQSNSGG